MVALPHLNSSFDFAAEHPSFDVLAEKTEFLYFVEHYGCLDLLVEVEQLLSLLHEESAVFEQFVRVHDGGPAFLHPLAV